MQKDVKIALSGVDKVKAIAKLFNKFPNNQLSKAIDKTELLKFPDLFDRILECYYILIHT